LQNRADRQIRATLYLDCVRAGGGYIAGRSDLIEKAKAVVLGSSAAAETLPLSDRTCRMLTQGLWMAPVKVGEALKGGRLIAKTMASAGFQVIPKDPVLERPSFITAVELGSAAAMQAFCSAVQQNAPVGSYTVPVPGALFPCAHHSAYTYCQDNDIRRISSNLIGPSATDTFVHHSVWDGVGCGHDSVLLCCPAEHTSGVLHRSSAWCAVSWCPSFCLHLLPGQ
jgi:hypothetical protein